MKRLLISVFMITLWLTLCASVHAYISNVFNAKHLLDSADSVCHGKVVSVTAHEVEKDSRFHPPLETEGGMARIRVINIVKGKVPGVIDVVFRKFTSTVLYTQLTQDEECILFLRSTKGYYRFVDDHNGKLYVPPHKAIQYKSESPEDRMVAELIFGTEADSGRIRLVCAEQLGNFAHTEAVARLKALSLVSDMELQGVAYAALIRLDHPPEAKELASFFARQDNTRSLERFGTTKYSNGHLKGNILIELHQRFNVICRDFNLPYSSSKHAARKEAARAAASKWKDFDLIRFLNSAPWKDRDTSSVIYNRVIADIVGDQIDREGAPAVSNKTYRKGSRSIVLGLLESKNSEIRCAAARAIDRMIAEPHKFPYPQYRNGVRKTEEVDAYVNACREWIAAHKEWVNED